jgi:hypothetical protein
MKAYTSSQQQQPSFDLRDGLNNIGSDFRQVSSHGGSGREHHGRAPRDGDSDGRCPHYGGRGRDYHERAPRDGDSDGRGPHYGGRGREHHGRDSHCGDIDGRGPHYGGRGREHHGRDSHCRDRDGRGPPHGDYGRDPHHERGHHDGARGRDRHGEGHPSSAPPSILNQLLSPFYILLLQGPVVLETAIDTIRESNPRLYAEIRDFLQVSGRSLFDALQKVGLVQNQDGSWSAPSSLSDFPEFFKTVSDAFTNSIYRFLYSSKTSRIISIEGVKTQRYGFRTVDGTDVFAIGVLIYSKEKGFLMQSVIDEKTRTSRLSDIGGKVDNEDKSLIHTLKRECNEEMNGLFPIDFDFISSLLGSLYVPESKYLILVCESPTTLESIDVAEFGTSENAHPEIERTVKWVSVETFLSLKNESLHPRLSISSEVKAMVQRLFLSQ